MNTASYDWLIVSKSVFDFKTVSDILNKTEMRFDQNIVATFPDLGVQNIKTKRFCDENFVYKKNRKVRISNGNNLNETGFSSKRCITVYDCKKNEYDINYYKTTRRLLNLTRSQTYKSMGKLVSLYRTGLKFNSSRYFHPTNVSNFSINKEIEIIRHRYNLKTFHSNINVVQYFKVRYNSTLFVSYLGVWSQNQSMALVESPFPTEARNFMGEYFKVGRCNYSEHTQSASDNEGPSAPELLDDVLQTLSIRLNATSVTRYYGKLGFRTYEGAWTGLLGALIDGSVDIALEPVTAMSSHHDVMDFIFPISKTMCSIYIRHHETSAVRDIFLAPFSFRLIVCVFSVVLIAATIFILIHRVTAAYIKIRHMSCMEGLIWSTGILCQQGGSWTPPNPSASILLIVCLLFALVIYNSYAAFITSVLSVRVASVGSVADVLQSSSFKIGYIKNSADQIVFDGR
ncbi:glutamate receptor 1 [Danaus plexippus plexippus]|uniref:Glutamate receptor 1 n=1 Tax=Danaus plexippus plexippus TaxID=278856 RepID=A0A212EQ32_DANPL|nr:glutamate receptor 1 [Danaus plexippus plexippus]